ncbi:MAG: CCA tRNA nucleotidyltransferase [Eubacterium sp.]|nr:CCA tRNA nucleotidyltransferase [Eubacterium sp.]
MKINMPPQAKYIIDVLLQAGFDAYIVGGCVRDSVLGKTPADWDITTSARPSEVKRLFGRTIDTGLAHGTVTVMLDKTGYEVTTYRIDGIYEDHRRPSDVTFTDNLKEDLMRRDFTINAMAYNDRAGLVDYFGGQDDLENKIIRCVGNPLDRFGEDALRMLRAVRFAAQLGFTIEDATMRAITERRELLMDVSAERIQMELLKMMMSDHPEVFRLAYDTGLTGIFFPEFDDMMATLQNNPHHRFTVGEHTLCALTHIGNNPVLRLTVLLHDVGKPGCRSTDQAGIDHFYGHDAAGEELSRRILRRLKFDNRTIHIVGILIANHDQRFREPLTTGRNHVRKVMSKVGETLFPYLLDVMEADVRAQSTYLQDKKLATLQEVRQACEEIIADKNCLKIKDLAVNGRDLIAIGISEGKEIGAILHTLLNLVLEDPSLNERESLLELASKIHSQLH